MPSRQDPTDRPHEKPCGPGSGLTAKIIHRLVEAAVATEGKKKSERGKSSRLKPATLKVISS